MFDVDRFRFLTRPSCWPAPEALTFCPLAGASRSRQILRSAPPLFESHLTLLYLFQRRSQRVRSPPHRRHRRAAHAHQRCPAPPPFTLTALPPSTHAPPAVNHPSAPPPFHPRFAGLVDVDGELKRLEKQVRWRPCSPLFLFFLFLLPFSSSSSASVLDGVAPRSFAFSVLARVTCGRLVSCALRSKGCRRKWQPPITLLKCRRECKRRILKR
jgi:hypothetical protein